MSASQKRFNRNLFGIILAENILKFIMSQKFQELIESERPVLIDFFATWCQPCKVQSSVLTSVKEKVGEGARIVKIDIDQYPAIASQYGVRGVPTLAVFKKGELLYKESGVHDVNRLTQLLEQYIQD